jgi:hypothetical protein
MKKSFVMAVGLTMLVAAVDGAQAQNGGLAAPAQCTVTGGNATSQNVVLDACQQAYDVFQFMAPQLGLALTGGNHTLGQNSALGGFPHFSLGLHATAFNGNLPAVDQFTQRTSGPTPSQQLPTKSQFLGLPAADLAIGIFGGLPLALTNVGGIDLLVSANYVPTINQNNVSVKPDQNLQFGLGARIGLLSESIIVPGVSFTYLKRDLPTTTITGSTGTYVSAAGTTSASLAINNTKVKTSGWRLVASKSLLLVGVAAGVGQDKYDQSADMTADVTTTLAGNSHAALSTAQSLTRTNYFFDANINLLVLKLTAEIGQVSGGTINTYNTFQSGRADKSQTYGSLGFRLGL